MIHHKIYTPCYIILVMVYVCASKSCQKEVTKKQLNQLPGVKCPHCGARVLFKKRPQVIKRVKAQ
ncbi:MAG: DNA-directed RNA polymerase subunit P [Promethearchaeota archaeon]